MITEELFLVEQVGTPCAPSSPPQTTAAGRGAVDPTEGWLQDEVPDFIRTHVLEQDAQLFDG